MEHCHHAQVHRRAGDCAWCIVSEMEVSLMDYKKQFDKDPTLIGDIIKNQWLVNFKQRANRKEVRNG